MKPLPKTFTKNNTDEVLNHIISVVISQIGNGWNIWGKGGGMMKWLEWVGGGGMVVKECV